MGISRYLPNNPIRKFISTPGAMSIFREVGFIGDSLSSGEHEGFLNDTKTFHDYYEYSWGQFIARRCGLKAYNFSQGGLKASTFFDYIQKEGCNPFVDEKRCQAYFIALGVNDLNHIDTYEDGFGSFDDVDFENEDNNKHSFVGQYVRIIQKLRKFEPKCRIFVLTMPTGQKEDKGAKIRANKHRDFLLSLKKYFDFFYVIDLRKYAPIYGKKFRKKYFLGGHMSALGYLFTADMVITYVDFIINRHPEDFAQIGFIGKGVYNSLCKW